MWNWATPERARRALWVMYKRLTSTRIHKFYTLLLLLTLLPLITLHLLALHNTSTGLTKLSTLLSFTTTPSSNSSSNSWEGSLVPTVIQQDGQGVLRVCNAGNVCETVTSVAVAQSATVSTPITIPTPASSSQTPQQVGSGASGGIAGDQGPSVLNTRSTTLPNAIPSSLTSSIPPSPDVVVQGGTPRPQPTGSPTGSPGSPTPGSPPTSSSLVVPSLAISQPPPVSSVDDGGVLIAAPPPTFTSATPAVQTPSGSGNESSSTGPVVADVPLVITTTSTTSSTGTTSTSSATSSTSTSTSSTSSTSTSTLKKSKGENSAHSAKGGIKTESSSTTSTSISTSTSTSTSTSSTSSSAASTSSTSSSSPTPTPVSEAALETASSAVNDATINRASISTSTSTSDVVSLVRPDFSTDLPVNGNEGPSGSTSTLTTTSLTSTSTSTSTSSTSTDTTSTQTSTTSSSSTQPDVDPTTESSTDVPTSSSSILHESDKGDVTGGNDGSTSTTSSTSTSTSTATSPSNSDESTPTETDSTDSTPTESKDAKETSSVEPSSSSTKETDNDESTSTSTTSTPSTSSTSTSSGVPDLKRALPLQRRYTGTLYGSPGSTSPLQARSFPLQARSSTLQPRSFSATPITNGTTGTLEGVDVTDVSDTGGNEVTRLGVVCAISMAFPLSQLRQDWIEDITMAAFYLCILGVGIIAIINESVAHLITAFLATFLAFLWTSTQLVRTHYAHDQFDAFITRSACSGVDVLPYYWTQRQRLELPILIINILALVFLGGLGFKLFKMYRGNMEVEKRYVYKVMLVLRCSILLGSFFLFSGTGIWLNFLFTNPGVVVSGTVDMLKGLAIVSLVFSLPWAVTGWFALREAESAGARRGGKWLGKRMMMGAFVGLTVLFLAGWVATFASDVYRAVFLAWTFFAVVSVAAFFVLVGSLGAGVVCWMRFGRDLDDFDSEKPRGVSVVSTESFGNPVGHLSHSSSHLIGGRGGGSSGLEVPRWDYSKTAEKAWEPFDKASIRQSQFTASDGRQSTVFSYGLRSPAPPVPTRPDAYGSSSNPNVTFGLAL